MSNEWDDYTKQEVTPLTRKERANHMPNGSKPPRASIALPYPKRSQDAVHVSQMDANDPARRKYKTGQAPIDVRLDLHGYTLEQAHRACLDFISQAYHLQRRNLLIITGKGSISGDKPTLRSELPKWLAEPSFAPMVVLCETAQPKHGGNGAFYVLIRRKRS